MSVQVSYKKQILFFVLFILVLLTATEIIFRVYDFYNPNCRFLKSDVFTQLDFNTKREICKDNDKLIWYAGDTALIPNQHLKTININSDGFRGDKLQNNTDYRIFVIGGSTTFGVGSISDSNTITHFLQKKISDKFPHHNIEVINAGIPGDYSYTETNLIKNKILSYNPNLLIIYDGWNDLDVKYERYSNPSIEQFDKIIRVIKQNDYVTPQVLIKLYSNYAYNNAIGSVLFDPSNIKQKVAMWRDAWIDICTLQDKYNFKTIVILQPLVGTGNKHLTPEEQKYFTYWDGKNTLNYYQLYADMLPKLEPTCTATYDLRNVFDSNSETIFFDFGHVGELGNKIIANNIYEKILPTVLEDIQK